MNEFTTLLVAKAGSSLVKTLKFKYLVHANEAVVAFALTIRPELILIDCDTCGTDPFSLCRELRTHPHLHAPCVVLISRFLNRPCDQVHALRCGASELLFLASDLDQLKPMLMSLLNQARPSLPLTDSAFHLLEASYHKECHSYLLSSCNQLLENAGKVSDEDDEIAQRRSGPEANRNYIGRLESMGRVATASAYDLNHILNGIIGFAEGGLRLSDAPPSCIKRFDSIVRGCRRATQLVASMLDFSLPENRLAEPFNVTDAISETLRALRASIPSRIQLTENHFVPLPQILGEKTQIQNLLKNLVINACHAIGDGPGQVVISTDFSEPTELHLQENPELESRLYVKIKVRHSGDSLPPEDLSQICDAHFSTTPRGEGARFGLALAARVVELSGGAICVDSASGKGSTFTLYFPSAQLSIPTKPTSADPLPQGKGERILFVDDEEVLGLVISESLSSLGYEATFAPTPEVALTRHRTERFDVVITDLSMPRMNGLELARSLWHTQPQQRVILTTGHAGKLTPEAVYALGFAGLLLKPFKTASLANLLQKALA